MKSDIEKLVNKYYTKVKKHTTSHGLDVSDYKALQKDVDALCENLFGDVVGERLTRHTIKPATDEYNEWYRKTFIFSMIMEMMGQRHGTMVSYYPVPAKLAHSFITQDDML